MRALAIAAAAALSFSACTRSPADAEADQLASSDTKQEVIAAGEAVGEAAVQVGRAARHVVTDAAGALEENTAEDEPAPAD
jgi:hypothetical protein